MSGLLLLGQGAATSGVLPRRAAPVMGSGSLDIIVTPFTFATQGTLGQVAGTTTTVRIATPERRSNQAFCTASSIAAELRLRSPPTALPESGRCRRAGTVDGSEREHGLALGVGGAGQTRDVQALIAAIGAQG